MNKKELIEKIASEPNPLSETQRAAVLSQKRYVRVIAGAGAGKTETLTRRIVYLLLIEGVDPSSIVAFTFTEKAAQSMKNRIYQRVREYGREDIAKRLGEMYIGTIHSFCLRTLEDKFSSDGYGNHQVLDANREMAFLMRVGWRLGIHKNNGNYSKECSDFLANVNAVYSEFMNLEIVKKASPEFYEKLMAYREILDDKKSLTFGRMIYDCVKKLEKHPEKMDYVKHLIVDEFQDIDAAQFKLIRIIGERASVFVVGDPRQSIYKWRGSNEEFFQNFGDEFGNGLVDFIEINENRRSVKKIVEFSNAFADTFEDVKYPHMVPTRTEEGDVRTVALADKYLEAEWVVEQINGLVKNGFRYSDIAILLRSVNTSATPFLDEMKKRKIPFSVGGKVGLFKRDDAQAIGRLLAWLDEKGFWVEDPWSGTQIEGEELLKTGIEHWKYAVDFHLPSDIETKLKEWKQSVLNGEYKTFKEVYYELLIVLGYKNLDFSKPLDAAIGANLGRVSVMIQDFEAARRITEKKNPHWKKDLHDLCWFMNSYAIKAYDEQSGDDTQKADTVQIMTVHQAKGLEWPVVFVSSLVTRRSARTSGG